MINFFSKVLKNCKTQNMCNRSIINIENWITPLKFYQLLDDLKVKDLDVGQCKQPFKNFVKNIQSYLDKIGKDSPEPFIKKRINDHTLYFTCDKQKIKKEKTLVIAFTGSLNRMMMPLPVFLQYLDANTTDVIFITCPHKRLGYRYGMPGHDDNFQDMLKRFGSLPYSDYKSVVGFGTSSGSYPILLLAHIYAFDSVLAVGPRGPNDERWLEVLGVDTRTVLNELSDGLINNPKTYIVYGSTDPIDVKGTQDWKALLTLVTPIKIEGAKHNALLPFIEKGSLNQLLVRTIFRN